jgi:hypothetical protein
MNCPRIGTCHLEENGAIDLCPVLAIIKAEAIAKTETAWASRFPVHEVLPLEHYQGTWETAAEGFTLDLGLGKIAALKAARYEAVYKRGVFLRKHELTPIDPKPKPQKPLRDWNERDFHEMPTETNDYCAYGILDHVEDIEAKELKAKADVTKKQRIYWRELKAREQIQKKADEREIFLAQLLYDMDIPK